MPRCQFTAEYVDYEIHKIVDFHCDDEEILASGLCIFHDNYYLRHYLLSFREEHKRKILDRFKHKVNDAISNKKPLVCIGFQLPDFSLSDLSIISKEFTKPVYFSGSQFFGKADFKEAIFQERAVFSDACFQGRTSFSDARFKGGAYFDKAHFQEIVFLSRAKFEGKDAYFNNSEFHGKTYFSAHFNGETKFNYVLFEGKEKVIFDVENLSNISFMNTDLTGVRFSDEAR